MKRFMTKSLIIGGSSSGRERTRLWVRAIRRTNRRVKYIPFPPKTPLIHKGRKP